MTMRLLFAAFLFVPAFQASTVQADETRVYTDAEGVTYRETRRVIERPLAETRIVERQQTVYQEQFTTDVHSSTRLYQAPVTEYHWEPYWANRWNPFSQPTLAYRYVPRTRWETRSEEVRTPVVKRELIPQTRTVAVPEVTRQMVKDEVVTRVAISTAGSSDPFAQGTAVARRETIGGAKLDSDPPRQGSNWQPAEQARR